MKINEFLIGCCKKKNYFLISAQPSKNLPRLSNKRRVHCLQRAERQKTSKVALRVEFLCSPLLASFQAPKSPDLCLHGAPGTRHSATKRQSLRPVCSFAGSVTLSTSNSSFVKSQPWLPFCGLVCMCRGLKDAPRPAPNSCVEAQPSVSQNVVLFGDGVFTDVVNFQ